MENGYKAYYNIPQNFRSLELQSIRIFNMKTPSTKAFCNTFHCSSRKGAARLRAKYYGLPKSCKWIIKSLKWSNIEIDLFEYGKAQWTIRTVRSLVSKSWMKNIKFVLLSSYHEQRVKWTFALNHLRDCTDNNPEEKSSNTACIDNELCSLADLDCLDCYDSAFSAWLLKWLDFSCMWASNASRVPAIKCIRIWWSDVSGSCAKSLTISLIIVPFFGWSFLVPCSSQIIADLSILSEFVELLYGSSKLESR